MQSTKSTRSVEIKEEKKEPHFVAGDPHDYEDGSSWFIPPEATPLVNAFSMGWMEDGRLGYPVDRSDYMQLSPRPIFSLSSEVKTPEKYCCQHISAGSRHSLFQLISCNPDRAKKKPVYDKYGNATENYFKPKPLRKLMITGLNQLALCEEKGFDEPVPVEWACEDDPMALWAGSGNCFVLTSLRDVYSWGHGRFGVLGHNNTESIQVPRLISAFRLEKIKQIGCGCHHVIAITMNGRGFGWGKNDKGQCGIGSESEMCLQPTLISMNRGEYIIDVSCGFDHTVALFKVIGLDSSEKTTVFSWGDGSRGQLGSGDAQFRFRPQENRWVSRFLTKHKLVIASICAGGYHNLAIVNTLVSTSGQVLAWGAGDYGQLGTGFLWDEQTPQLLNGIDHVRQLSAGLRHSMAIVEKNGTTDLLGWGYNGYGELGLGDADMRIIPTVISAFSAARPLQVSCGDRHTVVRTSHRPVLACESPLYKPFYQLLEQHKPTKGLLRTIKLSMTRKGLLPSLLDTPNSPLPEQAGVTAEGLKSERFERGLRYCMDTNPDPPDWRRNAYETCFRCPTPGGMLQSICLACARECKSMYQLVPWIRKRSKGNNKCDCRAYGKCMCRWSPIRHAFDFVANVEDGCIGPNLLRNLLQTLRAPAPLARDELIEGLTALANGDEHGSEPRIHPVAFEEWYRVFFDELEDAEPEEPVLS